MRSQRHLPNGIATLRIRRARTLLRFNAALVASVFPSATGDVAAGAGGMVPRQQPQHMVPVFGPTVIVSPSRAFMHGQGESSCVMGTPTQQPRRCLDRVVV